MEQGKQGVMVLKGLPPQLQNPIDQIQARYKHLENGFKLWLSKQSIAVEAAVVTTTSAAQGGAIGAIMGTLTADAPSAFPIPPPNAALNPQAMASLQQAQVSSNSLSYSYIQYPNFAIQVQLENARVSRLYEKYDNYFLERDLI